MQSFTKERVANAKETKVSSEVLQLATEAAQNAKTSDDLRLIFYSMHKIALQFRLDSYANVIFGTTN
jgi:hypothetical protein